MMGDAWYGYGDYMAILFTVMLVELAVHKAFVSCEHHIVSGYQNIGLRCPEDAAIGDPGAKKTLTFKVRWENSRRCYTLFDAVFPNGSVEAGSGLKIWNKELRLPENDFPPEILSSEGKSAVHPVPKVGRPGLQWQPAFEDLMQTYASKIFLSSLLKQFKQVPASRTPLAPHPGRSTRAVPNSRLEAPELHTSAPAQPLLSVCFAYRDA